MFSGIIRVVLEFGRPLVAVFCGARVGASPRYAEEARALGKAIAAANAALVYGGGSVGLMGVLADAALEAGAPVYGVIPASLARKEVAHHGLTRLDVVETMHERKARIEAAAAGFVALPGGFGTLDELFEIITWRQLRHHDRPIVLLNGTGFFDPLLLAVENIWAEGFAPRAPRLVDVTKTAAEAVEVALAKVVSPQGDAGR